ncbi:DUF5906 domain-containing protein [Pseudomonas oryzihabitans]|uniref:DUF5906 domain-containing protein n=1 Tax=Pseudomonas oryzihabitans TaxID=47885 RepID=UPI0028954132|nr:DUF5906 domain-containing protein [Pseudomonas oryzihabitans]MDT3720333.1 PriCT-2 domain-containing protein [Pseudomonas oryzihabitans]
MREREPFALADVPALLQYITADDRDTWLSVGMGLKAEFGDEAFQPWDAWSRAGEGYSPKDAITVWKSFRKRGTGFGTVVKLAQDNGWQPEKRELTAEDKRRFAAEQDTRRKQRQAEIEADEARAQVMREAVAEACQRIWDSHLDATGTSQYLERKQAGAHGVGFFRHAVLLVVDDQRQRADVWVGSEATNWLRDVPQPRPEHLSYQLYKRGHLAVPLRDAEGRLWSIQFIASNGKKLFPRYSRKAGCFHLLGAEQDQPAVVALAEGYATAASCHEATGWPVAVGIDSGNLLAVAEALRQRFPDARLVLAGDDDATVSGNPGRTKAEAAALAVGGVAIFPRGEPGQDWNDIRCALGLEAVRQRLEAALVELPVVHTVGADEALPGAPSEELAAEEDAASNEGAGEKRPAWDLERVFARFALVEGETKVFDLFKRVVLKKTAFEAMVTKALAKAWFDSLEKKGIAADQAQRLMSQAKLASKVAPGERMAPTDRYVHIDGTKDIWDVERRRRIPDGALKLALGDAFTLWVNSTARRSVDMEHLVFDPLMEKNPAIYINTFEGLPLTPSEDAERCRGIRKLVDFLCNDDQEAAHFLLCWLALPLQQVGTKMATAILLHSTMEGSGKSLLLSDIMRVIYGQYGATVGQVQLESAWSAWQSNKLYGVFEEVVSRDQRYNQVGKIKHMITGKTFRIESKFMNGWEEANFMNAVFLSNEILPWPISENDRRLFVMWPEETLYADLQRQVIAEMGNGGIDAFYGYLLNYDIGDFTAHTRPPRTPARQRLVQLSMASWQTFLAEWRGGLHGELYRTCLSSDLYAMFLEWCSRNKEHSLSHTKFSGFVASQVHKIENIPWRDARGRRRFGRFFVPDQTVEGAPLISLKAEELGKAVDSWRTAAREAGWKVDDWEHMKEKTT